MAGPSVMVRVLGDVSGLGNAMKGAGTTAESAAGKAHAAFSNFLGTINKTGVLGPFGEALSSIDETVSQIGEHGKKIGDVMAASGAGMMGVGTLLSGLGSKEQAAQQQLSAAITATGGTWDQYASKIDEAVKKNENFAQSSASTEGALQVLTQATHDPTEAIKLLGTATNLAAAQHESLDTAASAVAKTYNGSTRLLKLYGVETLTTKAAQTELTKAEAGVSKAAKEQTDKHISAAKAAADMKDAQAVLTQAQRDAKQAGLDNAGAMQELGKQLSGQAAASVNSFGGRLDVLKTKIEDQVAQFGQKYGPAITGAGAALSGLGAGISVTKSIMETFKGTQEAATAATEAMSGAEDAAAVSEGLALGPILLIVAAIAVLIAAAYLIYRNWTTIWDGIKAAVVDVWDWIKDNWPYILGVILGPFALAVAIIYKNWDDIKGYAQDAYNFIVGIWDDMVTWLTSLPGKLLAAATGLWHFIAAEASTVWDTAKGVWNTAVAWVTGLPAKITAAAVGLWDFFSSEASKIWTDVQNVWGGMVTWVTGLPAKIATAAVGMWHGITDAFKAALNGLIDLWNKMHFTIGGWHIGVGPVHVTVPKFDVGLPQIPHLAQGGLMTSSGLVYAHAGEVISPAPEASRKGPLVHVENVNNNVDIDLLAQRVSLLLGARM